jgi:NADH dehydrogenase
MRTILVVGGGYAGFYTAWKLEKKLRRGEARVIVVDPRPYMTYQPFLPEVLAGLRPGLGARARPAAPAASHRDVRRGWFLRGRGLR